MTDLTLIRRIRHLRLVIVCELRHDYVPTAVRTTDHATVGGDCQKSTHLIDRCTPLSQELWSLEAVGIFYHCTICISLYLLLYFAELALLE